MRVFSQSFGVWTIVLGSGFRWTLEQMDGETAKQVRDANLKTIRDRSINSIETNVIYAIATKNAG